MKIKALFGIIFIILVIITISFIYLITSREQFLNNITFLSKEETQDFIIRDEDNYIKNLSIYDLRARKVKTNDEYLYLVSKSCMDFTQEQKEKLTICSNEAIKYFNNKFNWVFALVSDKYEEGFPHTRSNIIFLSPLILNYSNNELIKTLIHESVHIYQRYNREKLELFLKDNNFTIIRPRDNKSLLRANPDLDSYIYRNRDGIEMAAYYTSENPKGISDTNLKSLIDEHPFEFMAYNIAENYSKSYLSKYNNIK